MILVTRLDGVQYYNQIESIEVKPDTTLYMLSGKYVIVKEKVPVILERIVEYRKQIGSFKNEE